LLFYHARYYHPYLNRWISPDTIIPNPANPQSLNRYSYVYNRPLVYVDPDGHIAIIPIVPIIGLAALTVFFLTLPGDTPCPNCETLEGNRVVGQAALWIAASCAVAILAVPGAAVTGTAGAKTAAELAAAGACADQDCFNEAQMIADVGTQAFEALSADGDPTNEVRAVSQLAQDIRPFKDFPRPRNPAGWHAHHLVEKRFWQQLGFSSKAEATDEILSAMLPRGTHIDEITEQLEYLIPYNSRTTEATLQEIWNAHELVYEQYEWGAEWLDVIWEAYFAGKDVVR
jgi:hypothetical protein